MRIVRMFNSNVKVWQMVAAMVVTSFALAGLAAANYPAAPPSTTPPSGTQTVITACAHKHSGGLRLLMDRKRGQGQKKARASNNGGQKPLVCRKNEKTLRWAVEGPTGPAGATGPTGDPGITGETGPTGPTV